MLQIEKYLYPASRRRDTLITIGVGRWWKSWTLSREIPCAICGGKRSCPARKTR